MMGGDQRINVRNWRHLLVLCLLAALFLGSAYWMSRRSIEEKPVQTGPTANIDMRQPRADSEQGRRIEAIFRDSSYQQELPDQPVMRHEQASSIPAWMGKAILYTLVALGLFTIAVFIWVLVTGNTKLPAIVKAEPALRKVVGIRTEAKHELARHATLDDARRFAADGQYGNAVRALLAISLIMLSNRDLVTLRPWLTGREIVRSAKLVDTGRVALAELVRIVEIYAFAGESVTRETYEACLRYHDLLKQVQGNGA